MKPPGMPLKYFLTKHMELWPLLASFGFAITIMNLSIVRSLFKKDYILVRGKYPWDKLDLLRHPYSRKLRQIHEDYDVLTEMDCLYKEMDKKERELHRNRKDTHKDCD